MSPMTVRYQYDPGSERVRCRVWYPPDPPVVRQCLICRRRVKPDYLVDAPPERFAASVRPDDATMLAAVLFTACVPVHGSCVPQWAAHLAAPPSVDDIPVRPMVREWDIHTRCYTIQRLRWYRRLLDAVDRRQTAVLTTWPLPMVQSIPTPRQAVGMVLHQQVARAALGEHSIAIALRGYDVPGERCTTPVPRCSPVTMVRALPYIRFTDRAIFADGEGLSLRLSNGVRQP